MLFGYDDKVELFKKLIKEDNLTHAYLFYGEREIGKATFAKFLASLLEGRNSWDDQVTLIDAIVVRADDGKTLGIDDVSRIREFLFQKPILSARRTVVVDGAEDLTREAQGALLKIVEEPPASSLILFVASDKRDLFDALLSRVEKVYFPTLAAETIKEGLVKFVKVDSAKAERISKISFGRFGRAVKLAESGAARAGEGDVEGVLDEKILDLYAGGVQRNHKTLVWLLRRQVFVKRYKRYNLNMKLQRKVIDMALRK